MEFNINDYVRVQLTDHGRDILREQNERLNESIKRRNPNARDFPLEIKEDAEGWSWWQLWSLMAHFGPYMSMASPLPFAATIELEKKP